MVSSTPQTLQSPMIQPILFEGLQVIVLPLGLLLRGACLVTSTPGGVTGQAVDANEQ